MKKKLIISNILIVFFALFALLISSFVIVSNSNYKKTTSELKEYLNITCSILKELIISVLQLLIKLEMCYLIMKVPLKKII